MLDGTDGAATLKRTIEESDLRVLVPMKLHIVVTSRQECVDLGLLRP